MHLLLKVIRRLWRTTANEKGQIIREG